MTIMMFDLYILCLNHYILFIFDHKYTDGLRKTEEKLYHQVKCLINGNEKAELLLQQYGYIRSWNFLENVIAKAK